MEFDVRESGDVTIVGITGKLNTQTAPVAQEQLIALIDKGAKKILIDLDGLDYISSWGLRIILLAVKHLGAAGGKLRLCNPNKTVKEILDISGFGSIFLVYGDRAEALDGF